jgi:hypothetical protein
VGASQDDEDATGGNPIFSSGSAYIYKNTAGTWTEVQKIVASDRGAADYFGNSVAISGDYAIVGAYEDEEDQSGGNFIFSAGSAYIYKNTAGTWSQVQKIVASDRGIDDWFGLRVAISGDYAIVGAIRESEDTTGGNTLSNAGSAYIFKNTTGTWTEVQKIVSSDRGEYDNFGMSVAISGDFAIVGADEEDEDAIGGNPIFSSGSAYIFKNTAGTWTEVQKIVASDREEGDYFGYSVDILGDYVIVGAYGDEEDAIGGNNIFLSGSAYIFKNSAGTWSQVQKIVASDRGYSDYYGNSVAISGQYAIVGAYEEQEDTTGGNTLGDAGSAYIYKNESLTVGMLENSFGDLLSVYPNPSKGNFTIDLGGVYKHTQISITDLSGKLIESKNTTQSQVLNLTIKEPAGFYIVTVQADNKKAVIRFVKE